MNNCTFLGRFGKDPEIRYLEKGTEVARFSLAVKRPFTKEIDWIDCVAWKKPAETIAEYCKKGDLFCVSGYLQKKEWEKDGVKKTSFEIVVQQFSFVGGKKNDRADDNDESNF